MQWSEEWWTEDACVSSAFDNIDAGTEEVPKTKEMLVRNQLTDNPGWKLTDTEHQLVSDKPLKFMNIFGPRHSNSGMKHDRDKSESFIISEDFDVGLATSIESSRLIDDLGTDVDHETASGQQIQSQNEAQTIPHLPGAGSNQHSPFEMAATSKITSSFSDPDPIVDHYGHLEQLTCRTYVRQEVVGSNGKPINLLQLKPQLRTRQENQHRVRLESQLTNSPPVPTDLCSSQTYAKVRQQHWLGVHPAAKDIGENPQYVSDVWNNKNQPVSEGLNHSNLKQKQLFEYQKEKPWLRSGNDHSYRNSQQRFLIDYVVDSEEDDEADLEYDNADDHVNAVLCILFYIMGLGVLVAFICLLYHYVELKETEQKQQYGKMLDQDNLDLMNQVFNRRVSEVILAMAEQDMARLKSSSEKGLVGQLTNHLPTRKCELFPPHLIGNNTEVNLTLSLDIEEIVRNNSDVLEGGEWKPQSCISRHRVAIIIPYRDRWTHLKVLLHYLIPTLKRQQIHFRIFVVEQYGNETFNKGRIMNAAFREALKLFDFECVTFHDVDLVPEDDRNMYSCTEQPKHMSFSIDKFQYLLPYQGLVGGVLMFRTEHFQQVNGYSNMYWGWGAEDDDMTTRILHQGLRVYRPPSNIARYKMVKHDPRKTSEVAVRMKLLRSAARRSKMEGLNNVQYKLIFTHKERLFTHFLVDIGHP